MGAKITGSGKMTENESVSEGGDGTEIGTGMNGFQLIYSDGPSAQNPHPVMFSAECVNMVKEAMSKMHAGSDSDSD